MDTDKKDVKAVVILELMKAAYATILREMLVEWVAKTDNTLDDKVVAILDSVFGYQAKQ